MFKNILLTILLSSILVGCVGLNTTKQTMAVVSSATNLSYYYINGDIVNFVGNADLTDLETTQVIDAMDLLDRSTKILKKYKENPDQLFLNMYDVVFQYAKIKSAYLSVRYVVLSNQAEYSAKEWQSFVEFDISAKVLDKQFSDLVDAVEANAAVMTALNLANTAIKVGSML